MRTALTLTALAALTLAAPAQATEPAPALVAPVSTATLAPAPLITTTPRPAPPRMTPRSVAWEVAPTTPRPAPPRMTPRSVAWEVAPTVIHDAPVTVRRPVPRVKPRVVVVERTTFPATRPTIRRDVQRVAWAAAAPSGAGSLKTRKPPPSTR